MDTKLMLQLLRNKTGEIQSLLEYFNNQPTEELEKGFELLSVRIENLNREFQILRNIYSKESPIIPEIQERIIDKKTFEEDIESKSIAPEVTIDLIENEGIQSSNADTIVKDDEVIDTIENDTVNKKEETTFDQNKTLTEPIISKVEEEISIVENQPIETNDENCETEIINSENTNVIEDQASVEKTISNKDVEDTSKQVDIIETLTEENTAIVEDEVTSKSTEIDNSTSSISKNEDTTIVDEQTTDNKEKDIQEDLSTLNDKLNDNHNTLIGENISSSKLEDIQTAIGINDKFLFIRELFESDYEAYQNAVEFINKTNNYTEVKNWIDSQNKWDMESASVTQFVDIIKRKF
jgi:hypothetical protein